MKKILELIRYLHANKGASVEEICRELAVSPATFYRLRNAAAVLQVEIRFFNGGYRITDYGVIDPKKL